ncbi:rCG48545 [Rattus norvegicus]|uniref:RCG48545 n=1 Tax=Rattus norvegicus TaxID=10116 RepID=A6HXB8_RAT|nr:rCG48545 [Rattus norvegicus]
MRTMKGGDGRGRRGVLRARTNTSGRSKEHGVDAPEKTVSLDPQRGRHS